jgi:undecaprenyl-diphosphatase
VSEGSTEAIDPLDRWFGKFDEAADQLVAHWRGQPAADTAAMVISNLSDYGVVWVLLAGWKARRPSSRRRAIAALAIAGVASYAVNVGVKALVRRERPEGIHEIGRDQPVLVRRPSSSSFPSGHTLAAFTTAALLPEGARQGAACLGFAGAVAAARIHLRAHHASDVVGGAVIGTVLGVLGRPLVRRLASRAR